MRNSKSLSGLITSSKEITKDVQPIEKKNYFGLATVLGEIFVPIGCGEKIIRNVHVGKNARIGANLVVVKDVLDNRVSFIREIKTIVKDETINNVKIALTHWY